MNNGAKGTKSAISDAAHEQYQDWVKMGSEHHPFLVCALCQNGGVVTIMAGYAVCWLCRDALVSTYHVRPMIDIAQRRARQLKLPFGPSEWIESFKADVKRRLNREKAQRKKADAQAPLDA